jgi:hypothetical protein
VVLVAVAVMSLGTFLPFVGFDAYGALETGGVVPREFASLTQSQDAPWIIVVLVILGAAAALHLTRRHRGASTAALLIASLAAEALGLLDGSNHAARVLPGLWSEPANLSQLAGITPDLGYYLFLGGAVVAFAASLVIASTHLRRSSASSTPLSSTSVRFSG